MVLRHEPCRGGRFTIALVAIVMPSSETDSRGWTTTRMPEHPLGLNLARIVERLTTDPRGWRVDELRQELRIADRTYRKYKRLLTQFSPWASQGRSRLEEVEEEGQRWLRLRSAAEEEDPALDALLARLTAFHLARQLFAVVGERELERPLHSALQELFADHRPRRLATVAHLEKRLLQILHVAPDAPKDYSQHTTTVKEILRALVYSRRLKMTYASASSDLRSHEIEPLTLALYRGGLYLFARYSGHPRVYNFVVDRIRAVERMMGPGGSFTYPSPQDYSPSRFMHDAFGIFVRDRAGTPKQRVELVFAAVPWLNAYLRERTWHASQQFEDLPDGRLRLSFEVGSLEEVIPWVRGFGGQVEVIGPPALIEGVAPAAPTPAPARRARGRRGD